MDDYFVQYKNELLLLALLGFGILICLILFICFLVKITKYQNRKIRNAHTMKLQSYMKLKNSFINFIYSVFNMVGMIFFISLLLHFVEPGSFSLNNINKSVVALYSLMFILIFILYSSVMDILHFFTTSIIVEGEVIHIRYLLFRKYSICSIDVLSFELRRGAFKGGLPPFSYLKFHHKNGKKRKLYMCLSEESTILFHRYFHERKAT